MNTSSKLPPKFLYATVGLDKGTGGMAELSRQVYSTLLEMQRDNLIQLDVHVLEGSGPQDGDELFEQNDRPDTYWYKGKRWRFALRLMLSKPDLRLFDHVGIARLPGLIPSFLRKPYILLIHGIEIWKNTRTDYRRTASKAALLIANSNYTAEKVRGHYPHLPEIRVCWPGKDATNLENNSKGTIPDKIGEHAMLIVGRLSAEQRHKGHDELIEVMPLILKTVPDAQLVIAGGGDDRKRLEAKVRDLKLAEQVLFTGWLHDAQLNNLYSQCALFVMPSDGDGFGMVFLEAMMHYLPCLGLRVGAAREIFEDENSGILVDREDPNDMAKQIGSLLLDESRRMRVGQAGYERYQKMFRVEHYATRLRSILLDYLLAGVVPGENKLDFHCRD